MLKTTLLAIVILLCAQFTYSASLNRDSLLQERSRLLLEPDSSYSLIKINRLVGVTWYYLNRDSAFKYLTESEEIARSMGDERVHSQTLVNLGAFYRYWGEHAKEILTFQEAWVVLAQAGYELDAAYRLGDIGDSYFKAGIYELAKLYYLKQLSAQYRISAGEPFLETGLLSNIGLSFIELQKYDSAQYFFEASLLTSMQKKNHIGIAMGYDNLGELAILRGSPKEALAYYYKELVQMNSIPLEEVPMSNYLVFKGRSYFGYANAYDALNEPDSVLKYTGLAEEVWGQLERDFQDLKIIKVKLLKARSWEQKGQTGKAKELVLDALLQTDTLKREDRITSDAYLFASNFFNRNQWHSLAFSSLSKHLEIEKNRSGKSLKEGFFTNHSFLSSFGIKIDLDEEKLQNAQERKIRNISIGTACAISFLFVVVLILLKNLHTSSRLNKENAEQLESLNQTKDKLMAILGHDLRSPFQSLMGLSEQVIEQIREKNWTRVGAAARVIGKSSREAYYLFENILGWAKTQSGELPFQPEPLHLAGLLKETHGILKGVVAAKNMHIHTDVGDIQVKADRFRIATLFRNLIGNSLKYAPAGSTITVSAKREGERIRISVEDEGPGLSPEELLRIQSGKGEHYGMNGLGLTLCREFIQAHGSFLSISSKPGVGSAFSFQLIADDSPFETLPLEDGIFADTNPFPLQTSVSEWRSVYKDKLPAFFEIKIYENSKIKKLLTELDSNRFPELGEWKEQLNKAVDECNEMKFQQLIHGLKG